VTTDDAPEYDLLYVGDGAGSAAGELGRADGALTVHAESSADRALERLDAVDCVVSAYRLDGTTGVDLLRRVRERRPEFPFLLFPEDGAGSESVAAAAVGAGATAYVPGRVEEPFAVLAERVREAVRNRRARERLRRSQDTYRSFVAAAPVPIWIQRVAEVLHANRAAAEFFGYEEPGSIVGRSALSFVPESDREVVRRRNEEMIRNDGSADSLEGYTAGADGVTRYGLFAAAAVPFGDAPALLVVARDITDRKEREERLSAENERLEEFASVVSHDLRNPLAVARANLQRAREAAEPATPESEADAEGAVEAGTDARGAALDAFDRVETAHDRMGALVEDLLSLAREGRPLATTEPTLLSAAAGRAWGHVETRDAELVVDSDARLQVDPGRFEELLENLFANAVGHGDAEAVRVGVLDADAGFYVEDDGAGVRESEREAVFDSGYTTDSGGTGLGLAIVDSVASAHGWSRSLTTGADGGARFEFGPDVAGDGTGSAERDGR
jgi:PAS domain S-box-containing protein